MSNNSPPRHRHDGTSPLPFGMDVSPPPALWTGPNTVWPHDPRTGWSYCVMIPSWTVLQDAKAADSNLANPIVFYRVQVGIQSPQGISTSRKLLRRFSDFLKLQAVIKRTFPKKHLPVAPPKNSMLWMNASQTHLQERRLALVDWLAKLLADIDVARSAPVAAFFELEAAARAAMNVADEAQLSNLAADQSLKSGVPSSIGIRLGPKYNSYSTHEIHGLETRKETSQQIEIEDLRIEQTDGSTAKIQESHDSDERVLNSTREENSSVELDDASAIEGLDSTAEADMADQSNDAQQKLQPMHSSTEERVWHGRRPSIDSIASEFSSARGSELSFAATGDGPVDGFPWEHPSSSNQSSDSLPNFHTEILKDVQVSLPMDQRGNVRRVLTNLQRRFGTAKADMEDLIARLNQETAVKEFLATKVRDLEEEVDSTKRKSRETLLRVVSMERDNLNNLQWELEEARSGLMNAVDQARVEQEARMQIVETLKASDLEKEKTKLEVTELRQKLENLQKDKDSMEAKARAEMRVLAKEIKALRKSQPELKEELDMALKDKSELETIIERERQQQELQSTVRSKFLHEVATLRQRLKECSVEFLAKQDDKSILKNAAVKDVTDLLMTSDNRIGLLAAEAQLLTDEKEEETLHRSLGTDLPSHMWTSGNISRMPTRSDEDQGSERALRKMLAEIFVDNAQLYKVVNSMMMNAVVMDSKQEKGGPEEAPVKRSVSVLNRFL